MNILLRASENVSHLDDLVLHQMLGKEVVDVQPTDERGGNYVVITVIHQSHLALEITENNQHTA